jgi:hypothetical protein
MRVTNESEGSGGAFAELVRLQTDFQARLADETLRYLRRLQGLSGPSAPGTVIAAAKGLEVKAQGQEGGSVAVTLEVQNMQPVYCVVLPQLTPLVSQSGTIWLPVTDSGSGSMLVAPGAVVAIAFSIGVPDTLTAGTYRGALILQGFREGAIPLTIEISEADQAKSESAKPDSAKPDAAKPDAAKKEGGGDVLSHVIGAVGGAIHGSAGPEPRPK